MSTLSKGDTVYTVDKLDESYKLCMGRVADINRHAGISVYVEWQDPKRDPSFRSDKALSKSPVVAILSRNDLPTKTLQAIEADAKARGLLNE